MKNPSSDFYNFPVYHFGDNNSTNIDRPVTIKDAKTLIVSSEDVDGELLLFLSKILNSVNLQIGQQAILAERSEEMTKEMITKYDKCILFGSFSLFEDQDTTTITMLNETTLIQSPSLSEIQQSTPQKKSLWHCLKKIYVQ